MEPPPPLSTNSSRTQTETNTSSSMRITIDVPIENTGRSGRLIPLLEHPHRFNPRRGIRVFGRERNYYLEYYLRVRAQNMNSSEASTAPRAASNLNMLSSSSISRNVPIIVAQTTTPDPASSDNQVQPQQTTNSITDWVTSPFSYFQTSDLLRSRRMEIQEILNGAINQFVSTDELQMFDPTFHNGLTKQEINRHTISYKYKPKKRKRMKCSNNKGEKNTIVTESDLCSICLDRFCTSTSVRRLPCLHLFHIKCIDKWLKQNKKCPICRIAITINYDNLMSSLNSGSSIEQYMSQLETTSTGYFTDFMQEVRESFNRRLERSLNNNNNSNNNSNNISNNSNSNNNNTSNEFRLEHQGISLGSYNFINASRRDSTSNDNSLNNLHESTLD